MGVALDPYFSFELDSWNDLKTLRGESQRYARTEGKINFFLSRAKGVLTQKWFLLHQNVLES